MTGAGKAGWLDRLARGLKRTSARLGQDIAGLVSKRKLDKATLEKLEELLIAGDLGVGPAARLVQKLAATRFDKEIPVDEVKHALAQEIAAILAPVARPLVLDAAKKPFVVLVAGVNGSGKTTTIAKLAAAWKAEGKSVTLAAADTFRAAAIEQLQIWGERTGCPVVVAEPGADPAGLAYAAMEKAMTAHADVLAIDTAGRLQNKKHLMAELQKVMRVVKKLDASAPHAVLLVMDATVGQNALSQVEIFKEMVDVTGLVVTKLDGSAKGGIVVALAEKFALPLHAVGIGEGLDDLRPFSADAFARALLGLEA
ncbi:MAG: signal recognition particle-docking protein FtsY [Rhodospirillales bacterium]|nr:signal recognition particle-docking protein FtsY [Rhodospirillales bacterium]